MALTIPNHKIKKETGNPNDPEAFTTVTKPPRQVAGAYFYLQLDCLVTYAHKVAYDFFQRPQLYTELDAPLSIVAADPTPDLERTTGIDTRNRPPTQELLARLRARYGSDERVPSQEQRDEIFRHLFGQAGEESTNGQGDFPRLRDELVDAATAFAERVFDTGEEMLRERVRTTHRPFKDFLIGLQGFSLVWSTDEALSGVARNLAYPILRDKGVSAVFGISTPPNAQWPFVEDSNAYKLIEQIAKGLLAPANSHPAISREGISNRQRAALRGAEALATILDFSEQGSNEDLDLLITKVYTWGSALRSLTVQPVFQPVAEPVTEPVGPAAYLS